MSNLLCQPLKLIAREAGDTIVEVLISMAVIGMILGGAYATASRSLRAGRSAQERTEALKQLETQIERLKYLASKVPPIAGSDVFDTTVPIEQFCIDATPAKVKQSAGAAFTAACQKQGTEQIFDITVTYVPDPANGDVFKINANWETQGGGTDTAQLLYKIQK